jgi:transcriptional regulator
MYVPKHFALDDPERIAEVLRRFDFALLISAVEGRAPVATHLPFVFDPARGAKGTLRAHMARANPHWRDLVKLAESGGEALVAFSGPHGYVSPSWYGPGDAVPTWSYVAAHAYGVPCLIEDPAVVRALLAQMVAVQEAGRAVPWSLADQDEAFLARMQRGIVAFEIPVARLEAKAKLSQNKDTGVRRSVAAALREGGETDLAQWMEDLVLKD